MKKGQVTIFIILGILILAVFAGFFLMKKNVILSEVEESRETTKDTNDFTAVKSYVDGCIEEAGKDAILKVSAQGGYYEVEEPSKMHESILVPTYLDEGKLNRPTSKEILSSIERSISDELVKCFNDFLVFSNKGVIIEYEIQQVKVSLAGKSTIIDVDMPLRISIDKETQEIERWKNQLSINYQFILVEVDKFFERQLNKPTSILLGELVTQAYGGKYTYLLGYYDDDIVVYELVFPSFPDNIHFNFGIKYLWEFEDLDLINQLGGELESELPK